MLLEKAERCQGLLDQGVVLNRAGLARQERTSTNRVAQVLRLLELPSELLLALRALLPGTPPRLVTERMLRCERSTAILEGIRQRCVAWGARSET
jgi:hypothetical protein